MVETSKIFGDLADRQAYFLSPHSDDIAFSASGALLNLSETGLDCEIAVVFSKSSFSPDNPYETSAQSVENTTQIRCGEDKQFVKLFKEDSVNISWLGFNDAPLRGYKTKAEYQSGLPLRMYDLELAWAVAEMVVPGLRDGTILFAPLTVGCHVDHRIVRVAAMAIKSSMDIELVLYEDMPYAARHKTTEMAEIAHQLARSYGAEFEKVEFAKTDFTEFKRKAIEQYPSQIVADEFEMIINYADELKKGGAERFWRVKSLGKDVPIVV